MHHVGNDSPYLVIGTIGYLNGTIVRILRLQVDFPLVEEEPLDGELLAHTHYHDSIVGGRDRPVYYNAIPIVDGYSYHGITSHPHKESANRMRYAQIIQA